ICSSIHYQPLSKSSLGIIDSVILPETSILSGEHKNVSIPNFCISPFTAYTVPLKKSTIRFFCVSSTLCRLIMTARRLTILSAISWASSYVLGSYSTTFAVACCICVKLTTFLPFFFGLASCCCSSYEGSAVVSSTYSYSYSSSVKKVLILFFKLIFSPHLHFILLIGCRYVYVLPLLQLLFHNHCSSPLTSIHKGHAPIFSPESYHVIHAVYGIRFVSFPHLLHAVPLSSVLQSVYFHRKPYLV